MSPSRSALLAAFLLAAATPAAAAPPTDPADRAAVVGQPAAVEVFPASVALSGARDARQLVVTGTYSDGTARDLTHLATARVEPSAVVDLQDGLFLRPTKNGTAAVVVAAGGKEVRVPV